MKTNSETKCFLLLKFMGKGLRTKRWSLTPTELFQEPIDGESKYLYLGQQNLKYVNVYITFVQRTVQKPS